MSLRSLEAGRMDPGVQARFHLFYKASYYYGRALGVDECILPYSFKVLKKKKNIPGSTDVVQLFFPAFEKNV